MTFKVEKGPNWPILVKKWPPNGQKWLYPKFDILYRFEKNPGKDVRDTEVNTQTHRHKDTRTKNQIVLAFDMFRDF